jgi:glycosyltransferase involved in cell wall biosynthesis
VDHPELWAAMGLAGRRHVVAEFNATEQGKRLEAIYREVMRKGR